jgi:hypothetical protein
MGHTPAGGSSRSTVHLAQGVPTGHFRHFDYGTKAKNQEFYGQDLPPDYDLTKISAPVALYWGQNDLLSHQAVSNCSIWGKFQHEVQKNIPFTNETELFSRICIGLLLSYLIFKESTESITTSSII